MSKFKVELEVLQRQLAEAEQTLITEAVNDGSKEDPKFLHFRKALRELLHTIDCLHEASSASLEQ
jgi:soluble cytochrome b562